MVSDAGDGEGVGPHPSDNHNSPKHSSATQERWSDGLAKSKQTFLLKSKKSFVLRLSKDRGSLETPYYEGNSHQLPHLHGSGPLLSLDHAVQHR